MNNLQKSIEKEFTSSMIDINGLVSSTQPPEFILKLIVMQKRDQLHNALDTYFKQKSLGQTGDLSIIKARLLGLFFQIRAMLKDHYNNVIKNPKEFESIERDILSSKNFDLLYKRACEIEDFLYLKKVIKFDNNKEFEPGDLEGRNKAWGYK